MREVTQTCAAVLLRHGDAEQAHVTEFAPHVGGEQVVVVDLRGARGDLIGDEGLHLIAQHVDGFTEGEIQGWIAHEAPFGFFIGWSARRIGVQLYVNVKLPEFDCQSALRKRQLGRE